VHVDINNCYIIGFSVVVSPQKIFPLAFNSTAYDIITAPEKFTLYYYYYYYQAIRVQEFLKGFFNIAR